MPSVDFAGVTSPVSGSIRFTVESPWLITQTSPSSPIAMSVGSSPTCIVAAKAFVLASIRTSEFAEGTASPAPPPDMRRRIPAAANRTTPATTPAITVLRRGSFGLALGRRTLGSPTGGASSPRAERKPVATSPAADVRSAGSLAIARDTTSSTSGGRSGRSPVSDGGGVSTCAHSTPTSMSRG